MAIKVKKGKNGVKVLNTPGQINPIQREPHDNTTDLEQAEFRARSKRKFPAPDATVPGTVRTAPHGSTTALPS